MEVFKRENRKITHNPIYVLLQKNPPFSIHFTQDSNDKSTVIISKDLLFYFLRMYFLKENLHGKTIKSQMRLLVPCPLNALWLFYTSESNVTAYVPILTLLWLYFKTSMWWVKRKKTTLYYVLSYMFIP